jgi:hypothetical protein
MDANNIALTQIDELGLLLAQIADLEKRANKIKAEIKDAASKGGPKVIEGNLYKATYTETNRTIFDQEKFIKAFGEAEFAKWTKTTAVFSVKTTTR